MTGRFKRGHYAKLARRRVNEALRLPGPDDDIDGGEAEPDGGSGDDDDLEIPDWLMDAPHPPLSQSDRDAFADAIRDNAAEPDLGPDPEPAHLGGKPAGKKAGQPKVRITAAVRKDIQAKIRLGLMPAGQVWSMRDPLCGGVFAQQEPAISSALADIVCDSPDLVAWFMGPAGGFMKYLNLIMACQPVIMVLYAHHIAHSVQIDMDGQQPQQQPAFAA